MDSHDPTRQLGFSRSMYSNSIKNFTELSPTDIQPYSTPVKQSGFPLFSDGDVLILSPTGNTWRLHSLILAQASPVFNQIFATTEPAHLTKKDKEAGKTVIYKLEMVDDPRYRRIDPEGSKLKAFRSMVSSNFIAYLFEKLFSVIKLRKHPRSFTCRQMFQVKCITETWNFCGMWTDNYL